MCTICMESTSAGLLEVKMALPLILTLADIACFAIPDFDECDLVGLLLV